jgi:hypothetical protein
MQDLRASIPNGDLAMNDSTPRSRVLACGLLVASALAFACGGTNGPEAGFVTGDLAEAPIWVTQGCTAYWGDDEGGRVCGVGSMGGTRNVALARTTALGRARTEIARGLQTKVKAMLKDYQSTTTGGEEFGIAAADEQYVEDVSKQITEMTLNGTAQQDMWISPGDTVYVLVALDVANYHDSMSQMTNLSENIRRAVQERSEIAFRELDESTQ